MTLHADARKVLSAWVAPDAQQEELRRSYLAHLDLYPDAMRRGCLAGHLTASTAIIDASGANAVLTLHHKLNLWLQTGGHCEEDMLLLLLWTARTPPLPGLWPPVSRSS